MLIHSQMVSMGPLPTANFEWVSRYTLNIPKLLGKNKLEWGDSSCVQWKWVNSEESSWNQAGCSSHPPFPWKIRCVWMNPHVKGPPLPMSQGWITCFFSIESLHIFVRYLLVNSHTVLGASSHLVVDNLSISYSQVPKSCFFCKIL